MRSIPCLAKATTAALFVLLLSACVVAPYPRHQRAVVVTEPAEGPVVEVAPPQPYTEVIQVAPYPGAVWIGGYWGWAGNRHQWVPGHWERARAGHIWRPHAWVQYGGRWHLRGGVWIRP